jgi:hypothetical protein
MGETTVIKTAGSRSTTGILLILVNQAWLTTHSINLSHYIQLHNTITLSSKFQYVDSINRTAIQNELQPNSITGS